MKKRNYVYVHTINGNLATYIEGEQICYCRISLPAKSVESLEQIRKEEKLSNRWRNEMGFVVHSDYSYQKVLRP
jgi:hypothetical protein